MQQFFNTKALLQKLTKTISKRFRRNVLSVIQIGSLNTKTFSPISDLDLIFIIKKPSEKLNMFLKNLFSKYEKPIDPSFIYIYKNKDPRILFGTHGYYMVEHLAQGKIIYGNNPFIKNERIPFKQIQKDVLAKIKEYIYERKKWFLTKDIRDIKEQHKFANRFYKAVKDLLIIDGTISNQESYHFGYDEIFKKAVLKYPWANFVYLKLKKIWNLKLLSKKELSKLIFILEKISYEANKHVYGSQR